MSFVEQFKDATIGFRGYTRLARTRGSGMGYMALLLLIAMAVASVIYTVQIKQALTEIDRRLATAPDFAVRNGEFSFAGPMPYEISEEGFSMIVDTTGKTTPEVLAGKAPGSVLLTRDRYYQVGMTGTTASRAWKELAVNVDKENVRLVLQNMHKAVPFIFLFLYLVQLGAKALDAILLGAIAVLYARSERRTIGFELGYKLGLYAMTISTLIQWIITPYSSFSPMNLMIWWGIAVLYLIMGLRAYFNGEEPEVE